MSARLSRYDRQGNRWRPDVLNRRAADDRQGASRRAVANGVPAIRRGRKKIRSRAGAIKIWQEASKRGVRPMMPLRLQRLISEFQPLEQEFTRAWNAFMNWPQE